MPSGAGTERGVPPSAGTIMEPSIAPAGSHSANATCEPSGDQLGQPSTSTDGVGSTIVRIEPAATS